MQSFRCLGAKVQRRFEVSSHRRSMATSKASSYPVLMDRHQPLPIMLRGNRHLGSSPLLPRNEAIYRLATTSPLQQPSFAAH